VGVVQVVHLGYTGTRRGLADVQFRTTAVEVSRLAPEFGHHGDCVGGDAEFHDICLDQGVRIIRHPPVVSVHRAFCLPYYQDRPLRAYLDRNQDIVDESDHLLAGPGEMEEERRSGTWSTIRRARERGIPITIVFPDGSVRRELASLTASFL
jgi:hypothetical protein